MPVIVRVTSEVDIKCDKRSPISCVRTEWRGNILILLCYYHLIIRPLSFALRIHIIRVDTSYCGSIDSESDTEAN